MTSARHFRTRVRIAGVAVLAVAGTLLATGAGWPAAAPAALPAPAGAADGVASSLPPGAAARAAPGWLLRVDLLVVSAQPLPPAADAAVARLRGVKATQVVDAARIAVDGRPVAVLGVNPSSFRRFAPRPSALDTAFWRDVADGAIGLSGTMGKRDKLSLGQRVQVVGRRRASMVVGGVTAVGVPGVDAVISHASAASLGFPLGNALAISVTPARLAPVLARVRARMPGAAQVEQLVATAPRPGAGRQGGPVGGASLDSLLTAAATRAMLRAALSRVGMPYVWGAAGPSAFDCSGLVQWSFARAGVIMPRVAADQARTGPAVPLSRLRPGDLLFYHTDPTVPGYISHVAIYLGHGKMVQAPQPGMNVEVVPLVLGSEFAGAIAVSPALAAQVAASAG